jgi:hypothetical protein
MQYKDSDEKKCMYDKIVQVWKRLACKKYVARISNHVCVPKEDRHRKVAKIEKDGASLNDSSITSLETCNIENIISRIFVKSNGQIHICVKDCCKDVKTDRTTHHVHLDWIEDIYYCHTSGTTHYCGSLCDLRPELNSDREYVCKISGRSTGKVESVHDAIDSFRVAHQNKDTEQNEDSNVLETENIFKESRRKVNINNGIHPKDVDIIIMNAMTGKRCPINTKSKKQSMIKETYRATALDLIASALVCEKDSSKEGLNSNKEETDLLDLFRKYVKKKNQTKDTNVRGYLPTVVDLELIASTYRMKNPQPVDISRLNVTHIKEISQYYALRCMVLWYILHTKIKNLKHEKMFKPWSEFVKACMSVFQKGVDISSMDTGGMNIQVIEPDPFLSFLHGSFDLNFNAKRKERSSKKNNSSQIYNDIIQCIYTSVHKDQRSPQEFCLSDVTFDDMDENVFEKIVNTG